MRPRFVSKEDLDITIDALLEHGFLVVSLTGGEALTHPHFAYVYKRLKLEGFLVTVFTNGIALKESHLRSFH